ncbi:MAG TPA: flagellar export chaperone FliS [Treponemataceae bacterium]|nr:flagellar export chaperone FliS [Treponemataceae bacterium]
MGYNQALNAYRETRVRTASQGTLIIMLYDEAIKQLGAALILLDENFQKMPSRIEQTSNHILKAQEIITELSASLDMANGGEIARNLLSLYSFFNQQLLEANFEKKPEKITSVRNLMDQLRMAWVEIINNTAVPTPLQAAPSGINIAG